MKVFKSCIFIFICDSVPSGVASLPLATEPLPKQSFHAYSAVARVSGNLGEAPRARAASSPSLECDSFLSVSCAPSFNNIRGARQYKIKAKHPRVQVIIQATLFSPGWESARERERASGREMCELLLCFRRRK
jgi:hypothetical protein